MEFKGRKSSTKLSEFTEEESRVESRTFRDCQKNLNLQDGSPCFKNLYLIVYYKAKTGKLCYVTVQQVLYICIRAINAQPVGLDGKHLIYVSICFTLCQ